MSTDSSAVEVLILRLIDGDEGVLADLFLHYRERLKRMVEFRLDRRLRGREDPSDVLQEVYLDARQRVQHYIDKPRVSLFLWLRQVTLQRLIDVHRRHLGAKMRDVNQEVALYGAGPTDESSAFLLLQLADSLTSPSQFAVRGEMVAELKIALSELGENDREVLVLRHLEELSNNEVAQILGIDKYAASKRYLRALERLRGVMLVDL